MKENSKTEQDLSEEQLREITGGCDQCLYKLHLAKGYQNRASGLLEASARVASEGKTGRAIRYERLASAHAEQAQNILSQVAARLQHHALPDLNLPPPQ